MEENRSSLVSSLKLPFNFIVLIWVIHFIQVITPLDFSSFGILPREAFGLRGILLAPLVHDDLRHLISNSAPLFFLSVMIMYFYRRVAVRSMLMVYLLTGFAVWLFARKVFHIGASGVVYGLVSFVFWTGVFRRSLKSIVLALIVTILYSGYFLGILPNQEGISWESHLLGGIVGILTAWWYKEELEQDENNPPEQDETKDPAPKSFFLDRDIFDKTKHDRAKDQNSPYF
jgi:membrane associated rhomboid family serine protease